MTKSRQEFLRRIERGRADLPVRRDPAEFDLYQANDVDDREIWRFLPALTKRLERPSA